MDRYFTWHRPVDFLGADGELVDTEQELVVEYRVEAEARPAVLYPIDNAHPAEDAEILLLSVCTPDEDILDDLNEDEVALLMDMARERADESWVDEDKAYEDWKQRELDDEIHIID